MSADGAPGRASLLLLAAIGLWAGLPPAVAQGGAAGPAGWHVIRVELPLPGGGGTASVVPGCMLTISDRAAGPSNPTRWSIRYRRGELVVIENSISVGDATIPELSLAIDGREFGRFPIRERHSSPEHTPSVVTYVSAVAPVTDETVRAEAVAALRVGSRIRIERRGRAFDAVLDGAAAAAFEACRRAVDG